MKKPIGSSRVTTAASGRETQLACAAYPRWAFTLKFGGGNSWLREQTQNIVTDPTLAGFTEFEQISGLFLACLGSYGEFYYSDPDDNSRENQFVGIGTGTRTAFPLFFTWGTGPFTPAMTLPVQGIASIDAVYIDNILQNPANYSMDSTNTILVFVHPPIGTTTIKADFHFYYRCRFLADEMDYSQWAQNLWDNKEVQFESVKP